MYKLRVVRLFVTDFEASLSFYSQTLGMPVAVADAESGWAELETGEAHLALERAEKGDAESEELVGRFAGVSLAVDDVATVYARLRERGVEFVGAPEKQAWGGTLAHLSDPDGNVLTLVSA